MATTADGKITIDVLVTQDKFDEAMKDLSGKLSEIIKNTSKEVEEEAKKTKKTFQESMEDIKKFGAELTDVGKQFQNWFGWAVKGVQDTTKAAMDWETAFTGVRKTVDATEEEFLQLQENIRGMSMEIPVDTTNLANMMEIAGQLGITGVDNLTKFTEVAAKMGVTTNLFGEEAATAFARIFNIMGEDFGNVDRMGSAIVDLGNNFATTEQEITEFTTRIAGAGKVAGLKTADILGIATAFSSIGVTAEAGGTAVQKVLFSMTEAANGATGGIVNNTAAIAKDNQKLVELQSQLAIATQQQKEFTDKTAESTRMRNQANIDKYTSEIAALTGEIATLEATNGQAVVSQDKFAKVLGMTNKEFQDLMKENPAEVFEKFVTALGDAGGEAMSILDDLDLSDSRLKRGFVGLAQNSDLLVSAINRSNKAWEKNTALNEEAAKRFATTESKLQVLKNKFHDMAITIGDELKKKLDGLLDAIEPIVKKISNFVTEHPKLIADILEIGTVIAGVGTAMTVLGGIISGIATLLGSWVGIIAAAVTAIVAARVIWEENLFGFRDMVTDATLAIENFLRKLLGIEPLSKEQIEQRRREAKAYAELRTEIQKNIDKIDELHEKAAKNITQKEDEIKVAKKYIDRLKEITTEDGHVVEGYEDEAEQIALLINEIIPGAVELRGDEKESIIKVTDALDDLIEKMRIEAYAEAYHDEYVEQLKQYQENLVNAGKLVEKVDKKQQNLDESIKDMNKLGKLMDNTMGLIALNPFFLLDAAITSTKKNNAQSGLDNAQIELDRYIDTLKKNKTFIEGYEYLNTGNIDDGIKGMKILDNQVQTSSDNITTTLQNSYSDQNYAYKGYSYAMQKDAAFLDETLEQWGEEHSVNMVNQQEATNEILLNNQEETNAATQTNQKTSNAAVESNDRSHWGTLISQQDTNSSTYKNNNQSWLNNLFGVKQAYAADIETEEDTMWTDVNSTNKTQSEEYATQTGIAAQEASDNFTTKGTSLIEKAVVALMSKMPGYGNNTAKSYGEKLANTLKGSGPGGVLKMISDALSKIKDLFKSHSPPKVGPLKEIDVWGENLGKTWAESFVDGMEQGMSEAEDFLDKEGQRLLAASQASTLMGSGYSGSANSYAYNNTFNFNVPTASPYEIERAARKAMYIRR